MNTERASQKGKYIGGGTIQAISKYLDRYFERHGLEKIGPMFAFGMKHSEEFPLPRLGSANQLPPLPPQAQRDI
jgi:hypothetical protein